MLLLLLFLVPVTLSQFTSQTYPDPRIDPFTCKIGLPGPVCDPAVILEDAERAKLTQRIQQLTAVTSSIRNSAPACQNGNHNLEIIVAVIDKIGQISAGTVDIEKFANNLKRRLQNFQDVSLCDTTVLIVNSRQDRQVFTVAGRDARISKDTLKSAFERNIGHFKSGRYSLGLEGMVEVIVASYSNAHIVQVPTPELFPPKSTDPSTDPSGSPFRAAGLPNAQPHKEPIDAGDLEPVDEKDSVWVELLSIAQVRCGQGTDDIGKHVRAVVEEAMAISLKLISDSRYNSIEEEIEAHKDIIGVRQKAWLAAEQQVIVPLYNKYAKRLRAQSQSVCPAPRMNDVLRRRLRRF